MSQSRNDRTLSRRGLQTTGGARTGSADRLQRQSRQRQNNSRSRTFIGAHSGARATKKPWSTKKKVLIGILGGLAVVLVGIIVALAVFFGGLNSNILIQDPERLKALEEALTPVDSGGDGVYYTLLIGSDSRDVANMEAGRSDTMMLVRIDPALPQAAVISIPRDLEINYGGYGNIKINAAFAYEQEAGAVKAVEQLCGVAISHYVEIDFNGVVELVDRLGGVDVVVPVAFELNGVSLSAGPQHLDGNQALMFSRARSFPMGDFQRVVDQRILLKAVVSKVASAPKTDLPGLVQSLAGSLQTDVDISEAAALLSKLTEIHLDNTRMATIPATTNYHDGVSYVIEVEPEFSEMMERFRNGEALIDPNDPLNAPSQTQVVEP